MKNKNRIPLELYIHIPFCVQKCQYCDFLSGPSDQETRDRYIEALLAEIQAVQGVEAYEIVSVFIGGGTPSVLKAEAIASIMETNQPSESGTAVHGFERIEDAWKNSYI